MKIKLLKKVFLSSLLLMSIILLGSCSGKKIQTVAEETEANQILDVLREHGIIAIKEEAGEGEKKVFEIYVNGGDEEYGSAIQLMEDHCLPQPMPPIVESSGLVPTIQVEEAQQLRRTKINIESQLRKLPGTTCVDITIVPPENQSLSLNPYKASATVLVKHKTETYGLNVNQIAKMVAGGVQGLTVDNVTVTLTRQPLRPLPDINRGRNMRRIFYIVGIGLTTILLFVGFVVFLRKRKGKDKAQGDLVEIEDADEIDLIEENENVEEVVLIDDGDADADSDENDEAVN